jgi:aerobic carbon-monoxide dehydrogenase medium subunit
MRFAAPATVEEAVRLLGAEPGNARVLAGGSDLIVQMRSGRLEPALVVDLKRIKAMTTITEEAGGFRIGACVPCIALEENKALAKAWPGVVEGARLIGSTQVQGRATMAGNLCNASPAADSVPALISASAKVRIAGPKGTRQVDVEAVPVAPGKTSLAKDEIVESIFLPAKPARSGDAYLRFIPRTEMDIAVVGAGVFVTVDASGMITNARVALGAVAPTVLLVAPAAAAIVGTKLDGKTLEALASAASAACNPIDDKRGTKEFRVKIAGVLARRAAETAYARAKGQN